MKKLLRVITKSFVILLLTLTFSGVIAAACVSPPDKPPKPTPPPKPAKIITKPCPPLKPSHDGKGWKGSKGESYPLSNPCYAFYNLNQIAGKEGEEGIEGVLPKFLSSELTQNFSQEEFAQAIAEAKDIFGEIAGFNFPNEFTVQDDWAEATLEVTTSSGQNLKFLVIFHQEGGSWKIFGTEEI